MFIKYTDGKDTNLQTDKYCKIIQRTEGAVLDGVYNGSPGGSARTYVYGDMPGNSHQEWKFIETTALGYYKIVQRTEGAVLDGVYNGSPGGSACTYVYGDMPGNSHQEWRFSGSCTDTTPTLPPLPPCDASTLDYSIALIAFSALTLFFD